MKRGDILCYRYALGDRNLYCKRLIGLPGDHIEIQGKKIILNHKKISQKQLPELECDTARLDPPAAREAFNCFEEDLDGLKYKTIWGSRPDFGDNYGPEFIPGGNYFFLGDNRGQSFDGRMSRARKDDIRGKVISIERRN
jgi:signal peptidase I